MIDGSRGRITVKPNNSIISERVTILDVYVRYAAPIGGLPSPSPERGSDEPFVSDGIDESPSVFTARFMFAAVNKGGKTTGAEHFDARDY